MKIKRATIRAITRFTNNSKNNEMRIYKYIFATEITIGALLTQCIFFIQYIFTFISILFIGLLSWIAHQRSSWSRCTSWVCTSVQHWLTCAPWHSLDPNDICYSYVAHIVPVSLPSLHTLLKDLDTSGIVITSLILLRASGGQTLHNWVSFMAFGVQSGCEQQNCDEYEFHK